MGLLDNNNVRILQQSSVITGSKAVNQGTIAEFSGLKNPYACIRVKLSTSGAVRLALLDETTDGQTSYIPIYNIEGKIMYAISASGEYYAPISGVSKVNLYSLTTVSGQSVAYSFLELATRPLLFDMRPTQAILTGVNTLTNGATESRVQMNSTDDVFLYKRFKFFTINAVYKNSGGTNVVKTTLSVKKMDFLADGTTYINPALIESVANQYSLQSTWQQRTADKTTFIFNFDAASEGDKLYYEVIGIR